MLNWNRLKKKMKMKSKDKQFSKQCKNHYNHYTRSINIVQYISRCGHIIWINLFTTNRVGFLICMIIYSADLILHYFSHNCNSNDITRPIIQYRLALKELEKLAIWTQMSEFDQVTLSSTWTLDQLYMPSNRKCINWLTKSKLQDHRSCIFTLKRTDKEIRWSCVLIATALTHKGISCCWFKPIKMSYHLRSDSVRSGWTDAM